MKNTNKIVIFDLDGTLANIDKRRKLASIPKSRKINWKVFFDPKNIQLDEPIWPLIETFKALQERGYKMTIFTGRDSISKNETIEWLNSFDIKPDLLKMRPQGTQTPDNELKQSWLDELELKGLTKKDILCVFDDRDKVVAMWRSNDITCLQANHGNF